ncbi:hypothetical protein E3N88_25535 [Mikania micrantha]|uniref:DUF4219 domain-containing protein n=1 Tax=Mikania micrantha TaxID=192012 RepID=A0A5N6N5E9_9ASTR|nr:hypothetical protein E3N88_25535 [Mikania micrantha]
MTTISKHDTENGTLNKPPMFTPDDYDTWKVWMECFIRNQDFKFEKLVLEGPFIPTVAAARAGGAPVPKDPSLYSDEDYKKMENSLQQKYEGSDDVKENKKDMLKQKFENFCQENNEKMASQDLRYFQLVDELTAAGVKMENKDVIRLFLRSLPHAWNIFILPYEE